MRGVNQYAQNINMRCGGTSVALSLIHTRVQSSTHLCRLSVGADDEEEETPRRQPWRDRLPPAAIAAIAAAATGLLPVPELDLSSNSNS